MFKSNQKGFSLVAVMVVVAIIASLYFLLMDNSRNTEQEREKESVLKELGIENTGMAAYKDIINKAKELTYIPVSAINNQDHFKGDLKAPVQIIVYEDFECPFCLEFQETIKKIEEEYGDDVLIAFRHYPLATHSMALESAESSECASDQGSFWEMHDLLFEDNKNGNLSSQEYSNNAKVLNLDLDKFTTCMKEGAHKDKIAEQTKAAKASGVLGTPATFINGIQLPGAYPFEDFVDQLGREKQGLKTIIDKELGR